MTTLEATRPTIRVPAAIAPGAPSCTGWGPRCPTLRGVDPADFDDPVVLLERARAGDQPAWDRLVDNFSGLVWSVLRSYRLGAAANDDVFQTVWLRLVEHADRIAQPERLAGWLATTTRNEALRVLRMQQRTRPSDIVGQDADRTELQPLELLVESDTHREVLAAFGELSEDCQRLLRLLTTDPPLEYAEVAEMVGRPIGSLGPTRARCLAKLRTFLGGDEA